ncbi:MAG: M20/M25/M40 family metallo-hydrolase [Gemmatimonadales bacterium]|nr:M20/M25/M40 family metallo-hydrolase [Gemmatimonadales bacterium]
MASTWPAEVELLRELVAIPSVSGEEALVAERCERVARGWGLDVARDDAGVRVEVAGPRPGPTLAFLTHLDVVPPGVGWTRDPWQPVIEGDRLYGRGSGDAKASVASMLLAAHDLARAGGPARGRLVVVLGLGEETKHTSMPAALAAVGHVDAAVVGEPTNLQPSVAQRGLMMADLVAHGDQRHAGYASEGAFTNAAVVLARDLVRLETLCQERVHPVLGRVTITPTIVEAGISRNVTPPVAKAVLDIRSTPAWTHDEIARELRAALASEVVVTSTRLVPCETPAPSRVLELILGARPSARPYGSPTCSDWVFVNDRDAVKCGPGTSRRSHTADECVDLPEVVEARALYTRVAMEYLA